MDLQTQSNKLRKKILESIYHGNGGHLGGCFSIIDFLVFAYSSFLKIDPSLPNQDSRDRLILSKGHCSLALYWTLADFGFFSPSLIDNYGKDGAHFAGHPELGKAPGIEISSGSLGHGPSIGAGMALGLKKLRVSAKVVVICGDGEMNEGSVWEAIMCAAQLKLDNFYLVIDNNKLESLDFTNNIISIEPLNEKLRAFNFDVANADGHDFLDISSKMKSLEKLNGMPKCLILDTIKGKGVSFTELISKWHFRSPSESEFISAMNELDGIEHL